MKPTFIYYTDTLSLNPFIMNLKHTMFAPSLTLLLKPYISTISNLLHFPLHSASHRTKHQDGYEEDHREYMVQP